MSWEDRIDSETGNGMQLVSVQCNACLHKFRDGRLGCEAFPGDIPMPILLGQADHRLPYEGDHGLRYQPCSPED